ncbi:MAG TPA: rhodanese-like domain-containing protein [Burkholderiales bacterium]|nr:rhodanese-like domain-containing protein [Burkholderiales bacterium]
MKASTIPASRLKAMLDDGAELALLDVREAGQFGEAHLFFAVPLPYSRLELDAPRLVPRRATRIVLCDDGASGVAALAARRLAAAGYADVAVLEGGTRGWAAAGYTLYQGVNVPSKAFGELVELAYHTPRLTPAQLAHMQAAGEDLVVLDGRPYSEYRRMNIPGGVCCPNAELPLRIAEIAKRPETKIVVNCAGRTRSIIGAQTLINFGVPNPVYALENGTQGWFLAGLELERGGSRRYPDRIDEARLPELRNRARALASRFGVEFVGAREVQSWLADESRTTYVLDVRTPEEYQAGSLPGAAHAPGGQLIQATDQWIGVRNARVVLFDAEEVRAPVVASWLRQLGCEAFVLEGGTRSGLTVPPARLPPLPDLGTVAAEELARALATSRCRVFDLRASMSYREAHIPGSRWSTRIRISEHARGEKGPIALVAEDEGIARLAAVDLLEAGATDIKRLEGGFAAWVRAGLPLESSPGDPPDAECIDYLFFVHDRHAGNPEAARQYLAWETGLVAQLDEQERTAFRIGPVR